VTTDPIDQRWRIRYTLDPDELAQLAAERYRQELRRSLWWWRLVMFTSAICTSVLTMLLMHSVDTKWVAIAAIIAFVFSAAFTMNRAWNADRVERKYTRYFRDLETANLLGPCELSLDSQQLSSTSPGQTLICNWKAIRVIRPFEWKGRSFLGINSQGGAHLIVPGTAFETEEQFRTFTATALHLQTDAAPTAVRFDDGRAKGFPIRIGNE
jgi:hypothetical protein